MMVSLPGATNCQLFWVAVDGHDEPVVWLDVPPVVPQPASVSNASEAAITTPPTRRTAILEKEGAESVCRESMSDVPPTVDVGDRKNDDAAQRKTHRAHPGASLSARPVVALVYHVKASGNRPRAQPCAQSSAQRKQPRHPIYTRLRRTRLASL